ncbi:FimB/Mfa2 family fimbrial subunit, partial [Parabacteroides sp. OttesenSCG-928-K15]|nr:FimB/Mfa2 family fimbrial subunit [Parabacteroides sp. OttesenSCG-928-K15]
TGSQSQNILITYTKKRVMRTNILSKGLFTIIALSAALSFTACSSDSDSNFSNTEVAATTTSEADFSIKIKTYNASGRDVTTYGDVSDVTLYIFNESQDLISSQKIEKAAILNGKTIQIHAKSANRITVVAWAGLTNNKEEVSSLTKADIFSDLRVQLKQNNGQVTTPPSDLYHGKLTLDRAQTKADDVTILTVNRKVGHLTLSARNITEATGDFYFKVKAATSALNFDGQAEGNQVEYIVPATMNENGVLVADNGINVIPSDDVTVELYRNDVLMLSSKNFKNTENMSVKEGKSATISFDASNISNSRYAVVSWGQVAQFA